MAAMVQYGVVLYKMRSQMFKEESYEWTQRISVKKISKSKIRKRRQYLCGVLLKNALPLFLLSSMYSTPFPTFNHQSNAANCLRSVVLLDRASFVAFPVASLLLGIGYWAYYMDKRRNFEACWEDQQ